MKLSSIVGMAIFLTLPLSAFAKSDKAAASELSDELLNSFDAGYSADYTQVSDDSILSVTKTKPSPEKRKAASQGVVVGKARAGSEVAQDQSYE